MAQHGYLREYDEGWEGRDDDRERGRDRDRSLMFEGRGGPSDYESARWTGRSGYGREHGYGGFQGNYGRSGDEQGGFGGRGDWEHGRTSFSAHPDDHYRSWRDRQMAALDRDYADYCREREQQFHRDFDDWRSRRRSSPEPLQTGMTQTGLSADPTGMTQAESESDFGAEGATDPMADATLGTSSSRRRR